MRDMSTAQSVDLSHTSDFLFETGSLMVTLFGGLSLLGILASITLLLAGTPIALIETATAVCALLAGNGIALLYASLHVTQ